MAAPVWITENSFIGTITQRNNVLIPFTATGTLTNFSLIAGNFPAGLSLQVATTSTSATTTCFVFGSPEAVPYDVTSQFVLRAKNSSGISDKTFTLTVTGATDPEWITPGGWLAIGTSGEMFAINHQMVDYQLVAEPNALYKNMKMRYFIGDNDGQLPNGLRLHEDGRIVGTIKENTRIEFDVVGGGYDGIKFDSYGYDMIAEVESLNTKPKFFPKYYQFYVTATDGINSSRRLFKMHVVDANSLRADGSYIYADEDYFLSSDSYLFTPYWLNPANLGIRRAGNYQIIPITIYDPVPGVGPLSYSWDFTINPEIKFSADTSISTSTFKPINNLTGDVQVHIKDVSGIDNISGLVGKKFRLDEYITGASTTTYTITTATGSLSTCTIGIDRGNNNLDLLDDIANNTVMYCGSSVSKPLGFELDTSSGNLYGQIPYLPAYSIDYKFTIRMTRTSPEGDEIKKYDRVFTMKLQGSESNYLGWVTTGTVGTLKTGQQSELSIVAENTINPGVQITYELLDGTLPPGLEFKPDGSIIGKIPYGKVTTIDGVQHEIDFMLDGGSTEIDQTYQITVQATDIFKSASIEKTFVIDIADNPLTAYSSMWVRPFLERNQRRSFRSFINNASVFVPKLLYRPKDPAFGIQSDIKMVIEHGIERLNLAEYIVGMQEYFYNKRFYFGDVKTLPAEDDTGKHVYDVVYVDIVDSNMVAKKSPDSVSFYINQNLADYTIATVDNWRKSLESVSIHGETITVDETLMPRFMRTIQQDTGAPLGFIKAVPLCYALPGKGNEIVKRIKISGFDFKLLDFEVDRLVIDKTYDYSGDKYLKFPITNVDSTRPLDVIAGPDGIILRDENGQDILSEY